jgi:hypothetical protein
MQQTLESCFMLLHPIIYFTLCKIIWNINSQIFQCFSHDLLDFIQLSVRCNLASARHYEFALRIDDSKVPPSATSETGGPFFHGNGELRIASVPRIKGTRHKQFFGSPLDNRVGENLARVLASLSSRPFDKVGKDGSSCLGSKI